MLARDADRRSLEHAVALELEVDGTEQAKRRVVFDHENSRHRATSPLGHGYRERIRATDCSLPSSSRLSNSPGETLDPVTATRIGWNALRGESSSSSASERNVASIRSAVNGSTPSSAAAARPRTSPSSSAGSGSTSWKKKPANSGYAPSVEIFSWTSGADRQTSSSFQS